MTGQQRGLNAADVALMRAIVQWRREETVVDHGTVLTGHPRAEFSTYRAWGGVLTWKDAYPKPLGERRTVAVEVAYVGSDDPEDYPRQLTLSITRPSVHGRVEEFVMEPATLTEAVDILVALGCLPPRFSSAYRAGWEIGREDIEHPLPAGSKFAAIVPRGGRR